MEPKAYDPETEKFRIDSTTTVRITRSLTLGAVVLAMIGFGSCTANNYFEAKASCHEERPHGVNEVCSHVLHVRDPATGFCRCGIPRVFDPPKPTGSAP